MLILQEFDSELLYHPMTACGPIPTIEDPDGIYPYESYCETSQRPVIRPFRMVSMENDHIRVVICPDLGGKVYSLFHKKSGKEILYHPGSLRTARILPRMAFLSGGIEVSFPVSHTPVQTEKLAYKSLRFGKRLYVWCGERELHYGMQWTVEYSLGEEDHFLTQRTHFFNPTSSTHSWMSWSNAALEARDDTKLHFPPGEVLCHDNRLHKMDWAQEGPKTLGEINRMSGYFWTDAASNTFGAYTPSLGIGLYHMADPLEMPGVKLWVYGIGKDEPWAHVSGLQKKSYFEIQAGPIKDQSIKDRLAPGATHTHTEYWIPSDSELDTARLERPAPKLLPVEAIPLFDWPDRSNTSPWLQLMQVYDSDEQQQLPSPPRWFHNQWPPSGMESLNNPLEWAISLTDGEVSALWTYYLALWHAARHNTDEAMRLLAQSPTDCARLLEARLLRCRFKKPELALESLYRVASATIQHHPQVVIERDLCLSQSAPNSLEERKRWLDQIDALDDDGLIERRIDLFIQSGNYPQAADLLNNTRFELVHQRYERTAMWNDIRTKMGLSQAAPPATIGEDDLAQFGAYRITT